MTSTKKDLERLTINLNSESRRALAAIMERTGTSKTDATNRALAAYAYLLHRTEGAGTTTVAGCGPGHLTFT
jgi:hypothetical protein